MQTVATDHEGAAAANAGKRTRRCAALGICCEHALEAGVGDAFFALAEADADGFFWQSAGYKNDLSIWRAANAAAVVRKAGDRKLYFHGDPSC